MLATVRLNKTKGHHQNLNAIASYSFISSYTYSINTHSSGEKDSPTMLVNF